MKKPTRDFRVDPKYIIVQPELNLDAVRKDALSRFQKISPESWEDFYKQMSKQFLYEDEDRLGNVRQ